jgi:hypothetical protein
MRTVAKRFEAYWDEMARCREAGAYWSLLHVTVCLPDICAALQSSNGRTTGSLYRAWCDRFAPDPFLTSAERWEMRNRLLHEGSARAKRQGRYSGYSFGKPSSTGQIDHKRVERAVLHLDVGELANEIQAAVLSWIAWLKANKQSREGVNVLKNLPSMARCQAKLCGSLDSRHTSAFEPIDVRSNSALQPTRTAPPLS